MDYFKGRNRDFYSVENQDTDGRPSGGTVSGPGLSITWAADGKKGASPEDVVMAVMLRLLFLSEVGVDGHNNDEPSRKFARQAVAHLQKAQTILQEAL